MSELEERGRCPVCRARLRENLACTRCGADVTPLLAIGQRAEQWRTLAQHLLLQGAYGEAQKAATQAQMLCRSEAGQALVCLTDVLCDMKLGGGA